MKRNKMINDLRLACYREFILTHHGREVLNNLDRHLIVELTNNILETPEPDKFNDRRLELR